MTPPPPHPGHRGPHLVSTTGRQPAKAAAIVHDVAENSTNLHLPLGAGSVTTTLAKLATLTTEYQLLTDIARSVDDEGNRPRSP
jgi:hypothetical protein